MYGEPTRATAVIRIGFEHLGNRIHRIAAAGLLRVEESLAAQIVHASASGAVLTWLSVPEPERNPALLVALRESMITTVTTREPAVRELGPAGAARALRATLPGQSALSDAEQQLLAEWLQRLSA
ncbi:hypothetical protein AB0L85_31270 [Streptomyces sp. NPDC052051]|uniref:hypothetical protein n=1 Tax=Streptomyces sp. NPDC052051 TaxID=3154649 RepID=UPI00342F2065